RWIPEGKVSNWSWYRKLISKFANRYAGLVLGSNLKDLTSGYRVYKSSAIAEVDFDQFYSQGYCFQIELAWQLELNKYSVAQAPIEFIERTFGKSKMSI